MKFVDELLKKLRAPILKLATGFVCAILLIFMPVIATLAIALLTNIQGNTNYALIFSSSFTTSAICLGVYSWLWLKKIPNENR